MLKKILSNTIVRLILAVLIGLLVGLVVNEPVLKAVMIIKQITGQIIFFLVPLIILGFVAPSIARLKATHPKSYYSLLVSHTCHRLAPLPLAPLWVTS